MKVKELIEFLLKNVDQESEVGIYVHDKMIKDLRADKFENVLYSPEYRPYRSITQEEIDKEILRSKKLLDECVARKNSNKYKSCLKSYEELSKIKLIPYIILN